MNTSPHTLALTLEEAKILAHVSYTQLSMAKGATIFNKLAQYISLLESAQQTPNGSTDDNPTPPLERSSI